MNRFKGISVSKGIAIGKFIFINKNEPSILPNTIHDIENELAKFSLAQDKSIKQLNELYKNAILKISENDAMIFKSHELIIKDPDFEQKVIHYIKIFKYNVKYSIFKASQDYINLIKSLKNDYMAQRVDDIRDIMIRLINNLSDNKSSDLLKVSEPAIFFFNNLMPSEILTLDKSKILGIVTKFGGKSSHTSILAQNMGIPMLVGVNLDVKLINKDIAILDSFSSELIISPNHDLLEYYKNKQISIKNNENRLNSLINKPTLTLDNHNVKIMANVTSYKDIYESIEKGAEGIGLFRSEFLYIGRDQAPSEDELFFEYKSALQAAKDKEVIIRIIDIGSDKNVKYISNIKEDNPSLGLRGIRLCFNNLDIFKTQLRALIKASQYGNLKLMIPMVVSLSEIIKVKQIIEEVKKELLLQNVLLKKEIPLGVMIETPSAVIISDLLAKHVDFFSIGTNDLIQYTLACDRNNISMSDIYNPFHISILRMIKTVVDNAHNNNILVAVCGEAASDPMMTNKLIGLGVDILSVDPQNLLTIKDSIIKTNYSMISKQLLEII